MVTGQADVFESEKARDAIVVFLEEYGSYLRLDTCLTYAAVLKADTVVDLLLSIAKRDPRHREMIKQTTKTTSMLFYEPVSVTQSWFCQIQSKLFSTVCPSRQCCQQFYSCYKKSKRKPHMSGNKRSSTFVPLHTQMSDHGKWIVRAVFRNRAKESPAKT